MFSMLADPYVNATIEELIRYAQTFSDDFKESLIGESEQTIVQYEHKIGISLPEFYRGYLKYMGRYDNCIFSETEVRTKIEQLQNFIDEEIVTGEDRIAPGCILVALGAAAVEQIWIDATSPYAVYEGSFGERLSLWADSFTKLLFRNVYLHYHFNQYTYSPTYSILPDFNLIRKAGPLIEELDAKTLWFSDRVCICAEAPGYSLVLHQLQPMQGTEGAWVRISGHRSSQVEWLVKSLQKKLDVSLEVTGSH